MGVRSPALPTEAPVNAGISHRRLLIEMAAVVLIAALAGALFAGLRSGFGVLFGGLLAFLNYFWLKRSTAVIFEKALSGESARFVSLRFIGRYLAIGAVLFLVYLTGAMPVTAVILGLAAFAFAVVIDGIVSIFRRNI